MRNILRKRKPIVYISLGVYLLLSALIITESCLPGGISGGRSYFLADIFSWIINSNTTPTVPKTITPSGIANVTDSSVLGQDLEGYSNIAIGTTTLLTVQVAYPNKKSSDVYDYSFELDKVSGNESDYTVSLLSNHPDKDLFIYLRVTANNISNDLYQIDINVANTLTHHYTFHIVDKPAPTQYECKVEKTTLKIGESTKIITKLTGNSRGDNYLRRYYDESKLPRSSSNSSVAYVDEYGVIHGVNEGTATIYYGDPLNSSYPCFSTNITVTSEHTYVPSSNSITYTSNYHNLYLRDYDYVFEGDESDNPDDYSLLVYPSFIDTSLEDQSFSYSLSNNLSAMLAPHHYDEDGYPIYQDIQKDDEGNVISIKNCVRVCGYRVKDPVILSIIPNSDPLMSIDIPLSVGEATPIGMNLSVNEKETVWVNEPLYLSATFNPKNVNDTRLHVEVSKPELAKITNNDNSSVIIAGNKVGKVNVTVTSVKDPTISSSFELTFKAKETINPDNYSDFHTLVRKGMGHLLLFIVTSIFGFIFFYTLLDNKKKLWLVLLLSLGYGIFLAGLSEFIQYFVPGRSGVLSDVLIDSIGYVSGTLISVGVLLLVWLIKHLINKNKNKSSEV